MRKTTLSTTAKQKCDRLPQHWKELLLELSSGCPEEKEFFTYVAVCTIGKLHIEDSSGFTPIPQAFLRKNFGRRPNWKRLMEAGLIQIKPYVFKDRCREYALDEWVLEWLIDSEVEHASDGQREIGNTAREHDQSLPDVTLRSLFEVEHNERKYNKVETEREIQILGDARHESKKANRRYLNDRYRYEQIKNRSRHVGGDIWCYTPMYEASFAGRICEIGGFQSMSRNTTAASLRGIDGYREYDLEASQPNALRWWFGIAGIDTKWLDDYLSTENYKDTYAAKIGVETAVWKTLVLALMFSATVPETVTQPKFGKGKKFNGSISVALYECANGNLDEANVLLAKFRELTAPLVEGLAQFKSVYLPQYVEANRMLRLDEDCVRREFINNTVGMEISIEEITDDRSGEIRWSKVMAFLLQGIEVGFIHNITALAPKYGYSVVANGHDSVLVEGVIRPEAIEEARRLSGFSYAKLVMKGQNDERALGETEFEEVLSIGGYILEGNMPFQESNAK